MRETIARPRPDSASRILEENLKHPPLGGARKRAFDVAMAGVLLLVLTPLMLAMAVFIRLLTEDSIFRSERLIGRGGWIFVGYRFRIPVAEKTSPYWAGGAAEALRASSLDKLPQLFNIIRGDMSLVGPRPRAAAEFSDYFA